MKKDKFLGEIKGLSAVELRARAKVAAEELMKLRFRLTSSQLEQTHRLKEARRNLARIMTVLAVKKKSEQN